MLNTIYAIRITKNKIWKGMYINWFKRVKDNKLIGIVSFGQLNTEDTVVLYTATNHRWLGYLDKIETPAKTTGAIYYVCD